MPVANAAAPVKTDVSFVALVVWLAIGGFVGVQVAQLGVKVGLLFVLAAAALFLVSVWLHLLIHEGGHVIAGLSRRMHLFAIGIGPLRLERSLAGWSWRWSRRIAGIGGFAVLSPTSARTPRAMDTAIFVLGGPLANLLAAGTAWLVAQSESGPVANVALGLFAVTGAAIGVVNLLPFRSGGWRSDGLTLIQLWRRPEEVRAGQQVQALVGHSVAGVRPRDWDEALIPEPDSSFDPMLIRAIDLLRLSRSVDACCCDLGEPIALSIAIDHPSAPDGVRQNQALMMASFAARCARSEALLAAWIPLSEGGLFALDAQREWLRAELAALRLDPVAAQQHIARSRAALPQIHDAATQVQMNEYLQDLEQRLAV